MPQKTKTSAGRVVRKAVIAVSLAAPLVVAVGAGAANAEGRHDGHDRHRARVETVYTLTNDPAGNAVLAFHSENGALTPAGSYPTGGTGTGTGLGSQGTVVVDDHELFAVDAGSNDVVAFRIGRDGSLSKIGSVDSGGLRPVSVTARDGVVYVLNAGDESVSGFRLRGNGLVAIPGAHRSLSGAGGAQISFTHDGRQLAVTEKASNTIAVLAVRNGVAQAPVVTSSSGTTPFGFAVGHDRQMIVSNANGGAPGASSLSSYRIERNGTASVVSAEIATTQTAACWVALSEDDEFAYTTNAGSGSISSYTLGEDGSLALVQPVALSIGAAAVDLTITGDHLYALANGAHLITFAEIAEDGALTAIATVTIPAGVAGIAVA